MWACEAARGINPLALFSPTPCCRERRLRQWRNRVVLVPNAQLNVRYWPLADIPSCTAHVRFRW
jgi:hypothetical protein